LKNLKTKLQVKKDGRLFWQYFLQPRCGTYKLFTTQMALCVGPKTRIKSIVADLTSSEQGAYTIAVGLAIQKSHVNNKWEAVFPCFSPHTKNRQNRWSTQWCSRVINY